MSESPTTLAARQAAESLQELELRLGCARIELKTRLENMARAADLVAPWENHWRSQLGMTERTDDTVVQASAAARPFQGHQLLFAEADALEPIMPCTEHDLLGKAIITLVCALAFDDAFQRGAPADELENLRGHWVPYADQIVDAGEAMGFMDDGMDDEFPDEAEDDYDA